MKKKIKLFSTIASLCLAVALMAFGVWAATNNPLFKVNSNVSFTASTDMFVSVSVSQKLAEEEEVVKTDKTYADGGSYGNYVYQEPTEMVFGAIAFTTAKKTLVYTITITNYTAKAATVTVTLPTALNAAVGSPVTEVKTSLVTDGENNALAAWDGTSANPTVTFTVTVNLLRTDISIADSDNVADFSFQVTRAA